MSVGSSAPPLSAALLTATGRGAVAVIRVLGPVEQLARVVASDFRAANGQLLAAQPVGAIRFGHWGDETCEEIVICRTSPTALEINCHGGVAAVQRILNDLAANGVAIANWPDQFCGLTNRIEVECTAAITRATTRKTALRLWEQRELWRVAADRFSVFHQAQRETSGEANEVQAASCETAELRQILARAEFGRHLTQPWRVAICGRPNVGKSTLINALLGYDRAIVFDQPGTTRDIVTGETALDGWPIVFADTAGLRETPDSLEQAGINRARDMLRSADARLVVFDQSQLLTDEDIALLRDITALPRTLVVANKSDLITRSQWPGAIPVSAAHGLGLSEFCERMIRLLIPLEPAADELVPISDWQIEWLQALLAVSSK